jgi:hypothetical protein
LQHIGTPNPPVIVPGRIPVMQGPLASGREEPIGQQRLNRFLPVPEHVNAHSHGRLLSWCAHRNTAATGIGVGGAGRPATAASYLFFPADGSTGRSCSALNADWVAVAFGLSCLGFFCSRLFRF